MKWFKKESTENRAQIQSGIEIELEVEGMTCDGCATHVQKALQGIAGVVEARVPSWKGKKAFVTAAGKIADTDLTKAVEEAGYHVKDIHLKTGKSETPSNGQKRDVDFDVVVIGTGGGGMAAAIRVAEMGKKVAIIEAGTIGGTCVNIGCVPSKALIRAAEAYHTAGHHPFTGLKTQAKGIDWQVLIAQKDALVSGLRQKKYVEVLQSYGENVTLIKGRAKLNEQGDVVVDEQQTLKTGKVIVATGARPKRLPLAGIDEVEILDSTTLMSTQKQPKSLLIIGGRAIALELGQAFTRFGTKVTILQRSPRLVPEHEPEIGEGIAEALREEGIEVITGVTPNALRQENGEKVVMATVKGEKREFRAEQVFMAVGRTPNTKNMGLERAGVKLDKSGFIEVDEYLKTSNPKIYAVGDVSTLPKLVYVAAAAGGKAAINALEGDQQKLDLSVLPEVIFTDPQIATVGFTEAQAREKGYEVKVSNLPLEHVPRALAARDTRGFIKLVADRKSDRLLGAHVLAADGGEIIQTAALAVKFGAQHGFTVQELRDMLFPYLTQGEGIKLAAQTFEKDVAKLSCCAG